MSLSEVIHRAKNIARAIAEASGILGVRRPPASNTDRAQAKSFVFVPNVSAKPYIDASARIQDGQISVFALHSNNRSSDIEWNTDPLTRITAPLKFGKMLDYRDERLVGNIKYVWEPNRHLELTTLGQAYALSQDPVFLHCIKQRLESWFQQCPYPYGVNWCSSLELGIRLVNWSLTWQFIGGRDSDLFRGPGGDALLHRWLNSIYQHAHFIHHYYSRYSSAANHLIGESAGVFIAACTWPYWGDLDKWGNEARATLEVEAERQTHVDGVNREQAISYQQFVLDFFLFAGLAGRAQGQEFSPAYWRQIEKMMDFICGVMDVAGNVPMFGDADDGYVVRLSQEPGFCPFRSLLNTGAVLFSRPEFAHKARSMDDKTRFLLGDASIDRRDDAFNTHLPVGGQAFSDGGYYVFGKDLETEREIRVIADAGPLGYLSTAAHGHADALSFMLSVAGNEILVDPGTYSYHTEVLWRNYFRGTAAHNTIRVDGKDQSVSGGNFMWSRHANVTCLRFETSHEGAFFMGEHDGYRQLSDPVTHRREIVQQGNTITVTDRILCSGAHFIEQFWHFSEKCDVQVDGNTIRAGNGPVTVKVTAGWGPKDVRHLRGSDEPPGGWVSRRFDVKVPADTVCFVAEIVGITELRTVIRCDF